MLLFLATTNTTALIDLSLFIQPYTVYILMYCSYIVTFLIPLAASSYCCATFGQSYGPVWLSNMGCTSSNNQLTSCTHDNFGASTCSHSKDAGAGCRGKG